MQLPGMRRQVYSRHLQTDYSPQSALDTHANSARLILRGKRQPAASPAKPFVLNSWKEISAYLGRGVRTVQRWEHDAGLPVHRPQGKTRSAVLAMPEELNEWLNRTPLGSNGNGNGVAGGLTPNVASVLLGLARDLLAQGERLVHLDETYRPEAEKLVQSVREIVRVLTPASGNVAAERITGCSPTALRNRTNGASLILSVDDEPALLYTRGKILEGQGYQVLSAPDGAQALEIFSAQAIDLVLLDYKMPGMNGGIVARQMKRRKPQVPVIMVSANRVPKEDLTCADCLIPKGEGPAPLLEKIRQILAPSPRLRTA